MNEWIHRTMIVAAQDAALARSLAVGIAGESSAEMFSVGLSPSGAEPATHYISAGMVWSQFATLLGDVDATFAAAGGQVPRAAIEGMYSRAVFSEEDAAAVMAARGLKQISLPPPPPAPEQVVE